MIELQIILNSTLLGEALAFVFGLIWGSFFNVCILRLPEDKSVVHERSHCPKCGDAIPWYLNVPVLSWLWLRGRCRKCRERISIQYPLVELSTGFFFMAIAHRFGWGVHFFAYSTFVGALIVITVIDLYHQIIPDEISLPGIVVGFIACLLTGDTSWWQSLLGILAGGGTFWAIAVAYEKLAGREGLGGGDVKLLGMIGAWLGVKSILLVIVISSGLGSIVGLSLMAVKGRNMKTAIPFGPFLALAAFIYLFWGTQLQMFLLPESP